MTNRTVELEYRVRKIAQRTQRSGAAPKRDGLSRAWALRWALAVLFVLSAGTPVHAEVRTTSQLLLDLARSHGLERSGAQTAADVKHIRALLEAAVRLDPDLAAAHVWLYELARLRGDEDEAQQTLRRLIAVEPQNEWAYAQWIDAGVAARPTIEERIAWLEQVAEAAGDRPRILAAVHTRLAYAELSRLARDAARAHLKQALQSPTPDPLVAALRLELLPEDAPATVWLRAALELLELDPLDPDRVWQVAGLLHARGLHERADVFFAYALELHEAVAGGTSVPGPYLILLARHKIARGELDQATQHVAQAIAVDPRVGSEAGLLLHWLLVKRGHGLEAQAVREQLAERFARVREPAEWPADELAHAAWFYCTVDEQPQRALMLAEAAAERMPDAPFVQRVLGWAQALNLQIDEARATLMRVAGVEPFAAYRLAKLLLENDEEDAARRALADLETFPAAGPAHDLLTSLDIDMPQTQPSGAAAGLATIAAGFDQRVLDFVRQPDRFVEARVTPVNRGPLPGEPWWVDVSLTNRGPFPVTLGPDFMLNPVFLMSFELEGDKPRSYPNLTTLMLDAARVLAPGQTIRMRRTIDVGPLRRVSRSTPQQAQRVTITALVDPVRDSKGLWRKGSAGIELRPVSLNRLPLGTSREALHALFAALTGRSGSGQLLAIEQMAELLGESQRARFGQLNYRPAPVPTARLRQALLAALSSGSWELRARALDGLQITGLDADLLDAARACLEHDHWLVRLLALRLIGERQGAGALERIRARLEDADEHVRMLAESYVERFDPQHSATTRPATRSAAP